MRPSAPNGIAALSRDLYDFKRALPRMSWNSENLYNLWQRTAPDGPLQRDGIFSRNSSSLYQQRFKSRRFLAGYHLEGIIPIKRFERWYLPALLPTIHADHQKNLKNGRTIERWIEGKETAGGRNRDARDAEQKARQATTPISSMMFLDVERRLDVLVFRACLASSVYQAKEFVVNGHVKVNGQVITNSSIRLNPGDLFSVNPRVINFLQAPAGGSRPTIRQDLESEEARAAAESSEASSSETSSSDSEASPATADTDSASSTSESPSEASGPSSSASSSKPPLMPAQSATYFELPKYAQASLFVPAYLLPNYLTCSCVYVRHPTARPGYSEIASPYDAGGDIMSLGWEWYKRKAPRMREHREARWWDPTRKKDRLASPLPNTPRLLAYSPTLR